MAVELQNRPAEAGAAQALRDATTHAPPPRLPIVDVVVVLGLIGTVAAILQTFSSNDFAPQEIIRRYSPAITATGSGLFMALVNILPTWVVLIGRELILTLGGGERSEEQE